MKNISHQNQPIGASRIRFCPHSRDRMRQYDIRDHQVRAALGPAIVDDEGRLRCFDAAAGPSGELRHEPAPGRPVKIGRCLPHPQRFTLLATTPSGQRLHVVCAPYPRRVLEVVTLWDPDGPDNAELWASHAQIPTARGERSLVPTRWCLGNPNDPRRHQFRPRNLK